MVPVQLMSARAVCGLPKAKSKATTVAAAGSKNVLMDFSPITFLIDPYRSAGGRRSHLFQLLQHSCAFAALAKLSG
jgi:hypothetical protein